MMNYIRPREIVRVRHSTRFLDWLGNMATLASVTVATVFGYFTSRTHTPKSLEAVLYAPELDVGGSPAITGTAEVGQNLTCSTGTWLSLLPLQYQYQWYLGDDTPLEGETLNTLLIDEDLAGETVYCRVMAANSRKGDYADSDETAVITVPEE